MSTPHSDELKTYRLTNDEDAARMAVLEQPREWIKWREKQRATVRAWCMERNCVRVRVVTPSGAYIALWVFPRPIRVEPLGR